jgi:nucleotide-binding universal stress UspA family protein
MPTKIIVSYDGSDADRDALALGVLLASAGASLELAYVRHALAAKAGREKFAEEEADALLASGAASIGQPDIARHVVLAGSTAEGLRDLAVAEEADIVVFGSEYRTAPSHVDPQASARRLLNGGPVGIALAPAGFAENTPTGFEYIVAITEDGDPAALEVAESLALKLGGTVGRDPHRGTDLLVLGTKPNIPTGRVTLSAASEYLIDLATCPVLVIPRGVVITFGS